MENLTVTEWARKKIITYNSTLTCPCCNTYWGDDLNVKYYKHDDGWTVPDHGKKQWVYVTCDKCRSDINLDKLYVPRAYTTCLDCKLPFISCDCHI